MKKLLGILLSAALLCTAGCQTVSGSDVLQKSTDVHTDVPGVEVRVAQLHTEDGNIQLRVVWSNDTPFKVTYGEPYAIERMEADRWVNCAKQSETVFLAIGYLLEAGGEVTKTYNISDLFDVTKPGTYRFKTNCSVYAGEQKSQSCSLWSTFAVDGITDNFPKRESAFKKPPEGILITPNGEVPLVLGGYSWTYRTVNDTMEAIIADQAYRVLPAESLKTATVSKQNVETVCVYVPETGKYESTNALGYIVTLNWETVPDAITLTCWPEAVWQDERTAEETVVTLENTAFYAKPGGYVYEIVATWENADCYGTANYYVHITTDE